MYCLKYLYASQITRFFSLLADYLVLCMCCAYRLPPSFTFVWSKPVGFLRREESVILKTVCFRVCSQKEIWTRPHQFWLPLLTQTSLTFSQQILHPQTTPHAFKPHAGARKTPTQFLAAKHQASGLQHNSHVTVNAQN